MKKIEKIININNNNNSNLEDNNNNNNKDKNNKDNKNQPPIMCNSYLDRWHNYKVTYNSTTINQTLEKINTERPSNNSFIKYNFSKHNTKP